MPLLSSCRIPKFTKLNRWEHMRVEAKGSHQSTLTDFANVGL